MQINKNKPKNTPTSTPNQRKQEIAPQRHKSKNTPLNTKSKIRELSFEPFKSVNIYKQIKL